MWERRSFLTFLLLRLVLVKGAWPEIEEDILAKYTTTTTQPGRVDEETLPQLQDVLDDLGLGARINDFIAAQVMDTLTFIRMKSMDLRMLELEPAKIKEALARIKELSAVPDDIVTTIDPIIEERSKIKYGRLFVEGSASSFEFYRGYFGGDTPLTSGELIWSEPRMGCGFDLEDVVAPDYTGKFVMVDRGECTFLDKSLSIEATGAAAMIIINNDDSLFHVASHHGGDVTKEEEAKGPENMAIAMVRRSTRLALAQTVKWGPARVRLIPMQCKIGEAYCGAILEEEKIYSDEVKSGILQVNHPSAPASTHEFLAAKFGSIIPFKDPSLQLIIADPADGCLALALDTENSENNVANSGKALLVKRGGGCSFGDKALRAQEAGFRLIVIADSEPSALQNVGASMELSKLLYIPGIFVTLRAGEALFEAASKSGVTISMREDSSIAAAWATLSEIEWPEEKTARGVLAKQLRAQAGESEDRLQWIEDKYFSMLAPKSDEL